MNPVILKACDNYNVGEIKGLMEESVASLGGLDRFIFTGETVLLKVNLLMKKRPEEATTTHPAFVEALSQILIDHGCKVIIGDSPGGPFTPGILKGIYRTCGYEDIANRLNVELNYNVDSCEVVNDNGKLLRKMSVIDVMTKVDKVVSVSKLKTHGMMKFTGAVKNMFGTVPGLIKAEYHFKMPEVDEFSEMLVDVCVNAAPVLSFMDGIVGMEGAGPSAGDPRQVGVILTAESPYALDAVAATIIGMDPKSVPTIMRSVERGFIPEDVSLIPVVGASVESLKVNDFVVPRIGTPDFMKNAPAPIKKTVDHLLKPRPVFHKNICIGCGECARCCPPTAIEMVSSKPEVDLEKCIRCYCCQELCPAKAVDIKRPLLNRLMFRL